MPDFDGNTDYLEEGDIIEVRRRSAAGDIQRVQVPFSDLAKAAADAHDRDPAAHGGVHGVPYLAPAGTLVSESKYLLGMDGRGNLVANSGSDIYVSSDDGVSWSKVAVVDVTPNGFRQLSDGEVLVGCGEDPGASKKATIWKSSGWTTGTPTFTKVLTSSGASQSFTMTWAWGHSGDVVVTNEYGTDARYVYMSQDCGATWTTIYDNGVSATPQRHLHGCTYDPWRNAIWISGGDWNGTEDNPHISVSWDMGQNWTKVTNTQQPTVIVAFPNCVCFGTDNVPNGVLRIRNPSASNLKIEVAYRLDDVRFTSFVALGWSRNSDDGLALVYFGAGVAGTHAKVLGSFNGFDWFVVFERVVDTSQATVAVGPTKSGNVVIRYDYSSARSTVRIPVPVNSIEAASDRAAKAASVSQRPAFAYFPNVSEPAYQSVTAYTLTPIQMHSIYGKEGAVYSYNRDDPDGMFSVDADGVAVTCKRAGLVQVVADACFNSMGGVNGWVSVCLNNVSVVETSGRVVSAILPVASGDKLSVKAFTTTTVTLVGGRVLQLVALVA